MPRTAAENAEYLSTNRNPTGEERPKPETDAKGKIVPPKEAVVKKIGWKPAGANDSALAIPETLAIAEESIVLTADDVFAENDANTEQSGGNTGENTGEEAP